jgi:uncharacterized protein (DUF58 family)
MSGAWRLLACATLALILVGLFARSAVILPIALPYLVMLLVPFWKGIPSPRLKLKREIEPGQIPEGGESRVRWRVAAEGGLCPDLSVAEILPAGLEVRGDCSLEGPLAPGAAAERVYTASARRGEYRFTGAFVRASDPLGLRLVESFLPLESTLLVWPRAEKVGRPAISPRKTRVYAGEVRSRESGEGVEFFGTRPYVRGDAPRRLNWKAGARWDLVITNLFEQERVADLGIVLDARIAAEVRAPHDSLFEHSVHATASLADYFLGRGNRVALLVYGSFLFWVFPGYGRKQRVRILNALARAEPGEHAAFDKLDYLPTRVFPAHSSLLLVSPLLGRDIPSLCRLQGAGYRLIVVSPDPVSFAGSQLPADGYSDTALRIARLQRDSALTRLMQAGVRVADWPVTTPLESAMSQLHRSLRR